jgi:hypothetical protein
MAKVYAHPDYPSLAIIEAESVVDMPQAGAFFVTHQSVVLSDIAKRAYGSGTLTPTKRLNCSKYNMQKCIYRYESGNCYSSKVIGTQATNTSSWGPGAWLSLCNVDKAGTDGLGTELGTKYQVIWVPPTTGEEPWDLAAPKTDPVVPPKVVTPTIPPINVLIPPSIPKIPGIDLDINVKVEPEPTPEPEPDPEPEIKKAGGSWILAAVLGAGALITVIVFAARKKKKKGKGKK